MVENNYEKLIEFLSEDDQAFLDKYLLNLTEEEFDRFMEENPEFIQDILSK